jgi:Phosphoesterase family
VNDRTPAEVRFPHTPLAGPKYSAVNNVRYFARIAAAGDAAVAMGGRASAGTVSPPIAAARIVCLMRMDARIQNPTFGRSVMPPTREPDSLLRPGQPAGTVDDAMPFDHIVVVMMKNHSFDNLLGALPRAGQPAADGLTFDSAGRPINTNPGGVGTPATVTAFAFSSTAQGPHVSQTWNATHEQINGGKMDGFVWSVDATQPMGYYPRDVLPFAYDLAATFTLANRWFCSAPCQTFPNRRFPDGRDRLWRYRHRCAERLGDPPPPNGTISDRLHNSGISWRDYFTDIPYTAIIPSIVEKYPGNLATLDDFFGDCAKGTLPSVSFVDPEVGAVSLVGKTLASLPVVGSILGTLGTVGGDEEAPQDMFYGEVWAHRVVEAVLSSPAWPRTVTDVVHDHTSVLATIEAKWNLPALTYRDANAATVMDFLDPAHAAFTTPPAIHGPSLTGPSGPTA